MPLVMGFGSPVWNRGTYAGISMGYNSPTEIDPGAMLAAARGFPNLSELSIPKGSRMGGPGFYVDLSRATTNLTWLDILDVDTTDACVATVCANLRLTSLGLEGLDLLTSSIVDGITRGQTAATLECLHIGYSAQGPESPLRAADVLRILQGCPKLDDLNWFCDEQSRPRAGLYREPCQAIVDLLESRGTPTHYYSDHPASDCLFECYGDSPNSIKAT